MKRPLAVAAVAALVLATTTSVHKPEPTPEAQTNSLIATVAESRDRPEAEESVALTGEGSAIYVAPEPEIDPDYVEGFGIPGDPCTPNPVTGLESNDACLESMGLEPPYATEDVP